MIRGLRVHHTSQAAVEHNTEQLLSLNQTG